MLPKIAIIGRTNVGKSTLFNRLVERQEALVSKIPGTTRDRNEADCLWRGRIIRLIDTGGLDVNFNDQIEADIAKQARLAMAQADLILFVVDLIDGMLPLDQTLAQELAKSNKPVIVVGNKLDKARGQKEQWQWPLDEPFPISAARGTATGDLLDLIYDALKKIKKAPAEIVEATDTRVCVIGKPNVGKSSIINSILGEERFIVSPVAHTTREPNDTLVEIGNKHYILIDTAGIRKLAKVKKAHSLESSSVRKSIGVLRSSDVALFVIDVSEKPTVQDKSLAGLIIDAQVGVILVANKWDLIKDKDTKTMKEFSENLKRDFPFFTWAPVIFTSAVTGQRVKKVFDLVDQVQRARYTEIDQKELDQFFVKATNKQKPLRGKGAGHPKLLGIKQTGIAPPVFVVTLKGKYKEALNKSYLRYLENSLRREFNLIGTPVRVGVRTNR
ncbi:MAG: ribosome biogenesis GTPase Der [Candidatus Uhrbacteria bacterium]